MLPSNIFLLYTTHSGESEDLPGSGLLRLHSSYKHDLKIYASDEGRVQMTAAAFAKVTQLAITCSKLTINTPERRPNIPILYPLKKPENL